MQPPSWRRDLTREIDLIEEVARIHGYDKIPEDVGVPMAPSHRRDEDLVLEKVRQVMIAAGYDEAMSASMVPRRRGVRRPPFWTDRDAAVHSHAHAERCGPTSHGAVSQSAGIPSHQ